MSSDKHTTTSLSPEEQQHVGHFLAQSHQIAELLHTSMGQEQAQVARMPFNNPSEAAQLTIVKALSDKTRATPRTFSSPSTLWAHQKIYVKKHVEDCYA